MFSDIELNSIAVMKGPFKKSLSNCPQNCFILFAFQSLYPFQSPQALSLAALVFKHTDSRGFLYLILQ